MKKLPSGLPPEIDANEDICRFIMSSDYYRQNMTVKIGAFLPSRDRETSVSRHGEEPIEALWELGLVAAGDRTLRAAAILKAADITATGLSILSDEPPPRHAVIRNWPWDEDNPAKRKADQKEMALHLCKASKLVLR